MPFVPFERITIDPTVATGKTCVRNPRFPVSRPLYLLASGETKESILSANPYLEDADIYEALRYTAELSEDETIRQDFLSSPAPWRSCCTDKV